MTQPRTAVFFQKELRAWYRKHRRTLPWRGIRNPYRILVSEVMLQQTQVSRVLPKYREFLGMFPNLTRLAAATRADVIRAWSGLGYNRRALNLQRAALAIVRRNRSAFPRTAAELTKLPGVGAYTAAAILAFAFHRRVAAVDTNQQRVIGRFFFRLPVTLCKIQDRALQLVPNGADSANWNHALMDFGALVCRSRPQCMVCPLQTHCRAYPAILKKTISPRRTPSERFFGSDRYLRGRIIERLRLLPSRASLSEQAMIAELMDVPNVSPSRVRTLLRELATEGFLHVDKNTSRTRIRLCS